MVDVQRAVGAVIRRERQLRDWRLLDVAERTGLSVVYLGEIERGKKYPSATVLEKIAVAFALPMPELFALVAAELASRGGVSVTRPGRKPEIRFAANHADAAPGEMETLMRRLGPTERQTLADLGAFLLARRGEE